MLVTEMFVKGSYSENKKSSLGPPFESDLSSKAPTPAGAGTTAGNFFLLNEC